MLLQWAKIRVLSYPIKTAIFALMAEIDHFIGILTFYNNNDWVIVTVKFDIENIKDIIWCLTFFHDFLILSGIPIKFSSANSLFKRHLIHINLSNHICPLINHTRYDQAFLIPLNHLNHYIFHSNPIFPNCWSNLWYTSFKTPYKL